MIDNKSARIFIIIGFLLYSFISLCYIQYNHALASPLIALCYVWEVAIVAIVFTNNSIPSEEKNLLLLILLLSLINVILNGLGHYISNLFNYSKKLIMFSGSLIWIIFCKHTRINNKTYHVIYACIVVVAISAIHYFREGFAFDGGGVFLKYDFSNTNQTGMSLATSSIFLLSGLFVYKNKYIKLFICFIVFFLFFLTYLTGCRSAILAVAFVVIMTVIDFYMGKPIIGKKAMILFSIFPIIFVFSYLWMVPNLSTEFNFGFEDAGKDNNTRMMVWELRLNEAYDNFILGDYYGMTHGTGEGQALNTHLDVLVSYGIMPLILIVIFIYKSLMFKKYKELSLEKRYGLYAFMACFIMGLFEAALFSGSAGLFIAAVGPLLLINKK